MTIKERIVLAVAITAVAIAGAVVYDDRKNPPPSEPASSADREGQGEVAEHDTASWKTYRNEEFGFEVKYPSEWFGSGDNTLFGIDPRREHDGAPIIFIQVLDQTQESYLKDLKETWGGSRNGQPPLYKDYKEEKIVVNDIDGTKVYTGIKIYDYIFELDNSRTLSVHYQDSDFRVEAERYLPIILSTFKFTK